MESRLLGVDPSTGIEEWLHHDEDADVTVIEQKYDGQSVVDDAERVRNYTFGAPPKQELRPVADIPLVLVHQWMKEGFNIFNCTKEELYKKLEDYPKLKLAPKRTHSGIIISGER